MFRIALLFLLISGVASAQNPGVDFQKNEPKKSQVKYPNKPLLIVSAISLLLAYDTFKDSQNLDKQREIILNSNPDQDVSDLTSQINRKAVIAVGYLGLSIISTFVALKSVKVTANNNKVGLTYQF